MEVITIGGLYGTIDEVDTEPQDGCLDVDGVYLTFELGAIKTVLPVSEGISATATEEVLAQMPIQPSKTNHQEEARALFDGQIGRCDEGESLLVQNRGHSPYFMGIYGIMKR